MVIDPLFKSLLKFDLPKNPVRKGLIKPGALPYVAWGKMTFLDNNDPVLAIGWGRKIYMI